MNQVAKLTLIQENLNYLQAEMKVLLNLRHLTLKI